MKRNIRFISLLTAALLLLSSCTSTNEPSSSSRTESTDTQVVTVDSADAEADVTGETKGKTKGETAIFVPGTYTGIAEGHGGPMEVAVTVDEDTIQSVEVTKETETKGIGDVAIEKVTAAILANQNVDVDTVTGCTISANAVRLAAAAALEQATEGDLSKLKSTELKEATAHPLSMETDVVVIGSGAAGLSAAITAAQNGAKVIILEKLPRTGGSTRTSSGMVVAGGSAVQVEGGIEDSIEDLKAYWLERGEGNVDEDMVSFAAEQAPESLRFLMDNGVTYLPDGITSSGTTDPLLRSYTE